MFVIECVSIKLFVVSDPGGVHAAAGAPPGGADRQLPPVQRAHADCLWPLHPQGACCHGIQRACTVELYQFSR